jgi:hypothetical protein
MKNRLCKAVVCAGLALGSVVGVPMSPEEIAELLSLTSQPKVVMAIREDDDKDDPLKRILLRNAES